MARSFLIGRFLFFRGLGLSFLFGFVSLALQVEGLIGANGILPAAAFLESASTHYGFLDLPTVFWLSASDGMLVVVCWLGALSALMLTVGLFHRPTLFVCWFAYLSLSSVGRTFLGFQWDILLTEVGLAALLIAPRGVWPRITQQRTPHRLGMLVMTVILFKLMFSSGLVKLTSGDETWRSFSALLFHYETQPLPTWLGWYAHQLPDALQRLSCGLVILLQLVVPWGLFFPRRIRLVSIALLGGLQLLIAATGNYCFFNLLALSLLVLLIDDQTFARFQPDEQLEEADPIPDRVRRQIVVAAASILLFLNGLALTRTAFGYVLPESLAQIMSLVRPFRSVGNYGLFAVMTTERPEIIVEGSADGRTWKRYIFKYKPGPLDRAPAFVAPHQPRLDWQMWFAALSNFRRNPWFGVFLIRLLEGSPQVLDLLEEDPFPERPPRFIRARTERYRFTSWSERDASGHFWRTTDGPMYMPAFSLEELGR